MARPTLDVVARQAEVSRQTVSNALNAPHLVRPDTLERVLAVISELGYRPHHAARTLRTRRSRLIGVRIESPQDGMILDRFLRRLTSHAQDGGYRVLLFGANGDDDETGQFGQLLEDHDLDAFVITGTHVGDRRTAWLAERRVPFVTFGRPWGAVPARHGWVDVDGAAGTAAATELLRGQGHRRIAFLGWHSDGATGDDRRDGWRQACGRAGLPSERLDVRTVDRLDACGAATSQLLDLADPPTAVVCVSDSLALGAWSELIRRGLRPGADVAVIGFDDSPTAEVVGLSSVSQPVDEAAVSCLTLLHTVLHASEPAPGPPDPVLLQPELVLRASTADPQL
jgi:DNA-binding LacI/PurR family transcriptional regulator